MSTKKEVTTPSKTTEKATETVAATPSEPTTTETVAATPSEPKVETIEIVEGKDKAVIDFFTENPKALSVLKVGDELFFGTAHGAAKEFAVKNELTVERIENPFLKAEA
jgi:hypothetical protein